MAGLDCGFTLEHYADILRRARALGYELPLCREFAAAPARFERVMVVRHDVDVSLDYALQMAEVEVAEDVRSTYFVRLHSRLYDPLAADNASRLRWLLEHGFEVGLHYEVSYWGDPDSPRYRELLAEEKTALESALGAPIHGTVEHMPANRGRSFDADHGPLPDDLLDELRLQYEGYSPLFTRQLTYLSDSNQRWKRECVHHWLGREDRIYALFHPVWWVGTGPARRDEIIAQLRQGY
jgi:hypothetical protein